MSLSFKSLMQPFEQPSCKKKLLVSKAIKRRINTMQREKQKPQSHCVAASSYNFGTK
jgi:hypothetical protein